MKNTDKNVFSRWLALALLFVTWPLMAAVAQGLDDEPLPPDQAFVLTLSAPDANTIRAQWVIVDGYYMYREKFQFRSDTPGVTLGTAQIPPGKVKHDEFFGEVETYRNGVTIDIPVTRSGAGNTLNLTVVSQGCADIGICYPPQTQKMSVALPPAATAPATAPTSSSPLQALKQFGQSLGLGSSSFDPLPVDQAFEFSARVINGNMIRAEWRIADGYYLYRDKFSFAIEDAQGIAVGVPNLPQGIMKTDESFGEMMVYTKEVAIDIPLSRQQLDPTSITLVAKYQGCAEAGFCYPPTTQRTALQLPAGAAQTATATKADAAAGDPVSEQDRLANFLLENPLWLSAGLFFLAGLGLAFTPCVFPMVPILSGIIVGQGGNIGTRKAFSLSLAYVLAMALTYTIAGVVVAMMGANLQAWFQNPWVLGVFAGIFGLLALSMFGFFELQMPSSVQSKLAEMSNRQGGGTLIGAAIMGFLSALIVGPCVTAPLMAALLVIGQTGDPVLGATALFALSMGMGAPLLAIGTSAGKLLPRAGGWMDAVKAVFGVLLLAVAIWLLERVIPAVATMALWAVLLIMSGVYLGALDSLGSGVSGWRKLWKGFGVIALLYGVFLLIGVASDNKDLMQPLKGAPVVVSGGGAAGTNAVPDKLPFVGIKGEAGLEQALASARAQGKPVFLDFYADWCISCKEMEKFTFSDSGVRQALGEFVLLKADVTANDEQDQALMKRFSLFGPPAMIFFDRAGEERRAYRLVGFVKPEPFLAHVQKAAE